MKGIDEKCSHGLKTVEDMVLLGNRAIESAKGKVPHERNIQPVIEEKHRAMFEPGADKRACFIAENEEKYRMGSGKEESNIEQDDGR